MIRAPAKTKGSHRKDKVGSSKGHDFGSEKHFLLVGSPEFTQLLHKANIQACAYGSAHHDELRSTLPAVSLVGTDAPSLESAFSEFQRWAAKEGGDAVEMNFVFLRDGGYVLGISPHSDRMYRRLSGHDRTSSPILFLATWIKKFDSRNPMLEGLRKYKQSVVSPFIFSAVLRSPQKQLEQLQPSELHPISAVQSLLKFEATFVDEDDVQPNTSAYVVLRTHRGKVRKSPDKLAIQRDIHARRTNPVSYFHRRDEILQRHFPVTLARLRHNPAYRDRVTAIREQGVSDWQYEQAMCNLVLSKAICGVPHYQSVSRNEFRRRIMEGLGKMFEQADGSDALTKFGPDQILEQARLDAVALLTEFDKGPKKRNLKSLQAQLKQRRLLDCEDV